MGPGDSGVEQTPVAAAGLDPDSAEWLRVLVDTGPRREAALARLHEMLLRIARGEVRRRGPRLQLTGPELDDLAYQAAAGDPVEERYTGIAAHLRACGPCGEDFEGLLNALRDEAT